MIADTFINLKKDVQASFESKGPGIPNKIIYR